MLLTLTIPTVVSPPSLTELTASNSSTSSSPVNNLVDHSRPAFNSLLRSPWSRLSASSPSKKIKRGSQCVSVLPAVLVSASWLGPISIDCVSVLEGSRVLSGDMLID